jgi:hypothetical protein
MGVAELGAFNSVDEPGPVSMCSSQGSSGAVNLSLAHKARMLRRGNYIEIECKPASSICPTETSSTTE